jgi:hypothetical protein
MVAAIFLCGACLAISEQQHPGLARFLAARLRNKSSKRQGVVTKATIRVPRPMNRITAFRPRSNATFSHWRISNRGSLPAMVEVTGVQFYSDPECHVSLAIPANGGWDAPDKAQCGRSGCQLCSEGCDRCGTVCGRAIDGNASTSWRPRKEDIQRCNTGFANTGFALDQCPAFSIWLAFRFPQSVTVGCITVNGTLAAGRAYGQCWSGGLSVEAHNNLLPSRTTVSTPTTTHGFAGLQNARKWVRLLPKEPTVPARQLCRNRGYRQPYLGLNTRIMPHRLLLPAWMQAEAQYALVWERARVLAEQLDAGH